MRRINIILLSITICFGGIAFFLVCRYTYESKKSEVNKKAKEAFIKAFTEELKSRKLEKNFSFSFDAKTLLAADIPDSVYFEDDSGKHWYQLDPKKHRMNVSDNVNVRFLHSMTFEDKPIEIDSLNTIWNQYLQESDIYTNSALGISITGNDKTVKSMYSFQSEFCSLSNQVFTVYVGYACEIEIVGYLHYSLWHMMYMEIILYLFLCAICVFWNYKIGAIIIVRVKLIRQKEIIEIPVVVKEMTNTPIRSYILHDNLIFYAEQQKIEKIGGIDKKLQPQSCKLLELFLKAKDNDYILKDTTIMNELWQDGTGTTERLHKSIGRLRSCIQEIEPKIDIKRNTSNSYQLLL